MICGKPTGFPYVKDIGPAPGCTNFGIEQSRTFVNGDLEHDCQSCHRVRRYHCLQDLPQESQS